MMRLSLYNDVMSDTTVTFSAVANFSLFCMTVLRVLFHRLKQFLALVAFITNFEGARDRNGGMSL